MFAFKELKCSTATIVVEIDDFKANLPIIFQSMRTDIGYINLATKPNRKTKVKVPQEINLENKILSLRYKNGEEKALRGIQRSVSVVTFPNSIMIEVGRGDRVLSVKLSGKANVKGARNIKEAYDCVKLILDNVILTNEKLKKIYDCVDRDLKEKTEKKMDPLEYRKAEYMSNYAFYNDETKSLIDDFLKTNLHDRSEDLGMQWLDAFIKMNATLYTSIKKPEIGNCKIEMINYQFRLCTAINPSLFAEHMNVEPFLVKYASIGKPDVKVYYPYKKKKQNKLKDAAHSFFVNKNGTVTFTGENPELMEPVYNTFLRNFFNVKELVKVNTPVKIKYIKTSGYTDIEKAYEFERKVHDFIDSVIAHKVEFVNPGDQDSVLVPKQELSSSISTNEDQVYKEKPVETYENVKILSYSAPRL